MCSSDHHSLIYRRCSSEIPQRGDFFGFRCKKKSDFFFDFGVKNRLLKQKEKKIGVFQFFVDFRPKKSVLFSSFFSSFFLPRSCGQKLISVRKRIFFRFFFSIFSQKKTFLFSIFGGYTPAPNCASSATKAAPLSGRFD